MVARRTLVSHRLNEFRSDRPEFDKRLNDFLREHVANVFEKVRYFDKYTPDHEITQAEVDAGVDVIDPQVPPYTSVGYILPERYGVNTTPGTTDMAAALDAAYAVGVAAGGGTILLRNVYYRSTSFALTSSLVDILGIGWRSGVEFGDCDGFLLNYVLGFGKPTIDNFYVNGAGTTRRGFYQAGTTDVSDEIYGLTIKRIMLSNFNAAITLRSVRNLSIKDCWFQEVNSGIDLTGNAIHVRIAGNDIVKSAGNGTGTQFAINLDSYAFAVGGTFSPEGVVISGNNLLYGFDTALKATNANYVDLSDNDIQANVYGVDFSTVNNVFNVCRNYIEIDGTSALVGVYGRGSGSTIPTKINIKENNFIAATTTSSNGVQINDSGNQNQNYVTVEDNYFSGLTNADIAFNNAGSGWIIKNRCNSSGASVSITVPAVAVGSVYIDKNLCLKGISWTAADAASGAIVLGHNVHNGTTALNGSEQVPTVASAAALTLPLGSREHEQFIISGNTNITSIVVTGWVGRTVTLHFTGTPTVTDGSNLALAGNLVVTANDTITLNCIGAIWEEIGRSVN